MKCGWCGMTIEASHFDCGKVISPPSPGTLPVASRMRRSRVGSCSVVVNDTHFDCSIWSQNTEGWPNAGRPAAIFSHSAQAPPRCLPLSTGAVSMPPRLDASVIDPRVTRTQSPAPTVILPGLPSCSVAMCVTVVPPALSLRPRSVTRVLYWIVTPRASSHLSSGRTIESYWL